jgi:hypothetical protein
MKMDNLNIRIMDEIPEKRGLHNWKNLFRKPTFLEWVIFFMIVMVLFMAWAYKHDIESCQDFVKAVNENPCAYCKVQVNPSLSNLTFKEGTLTNLTTGEIEG